MDLNEDIDGALPLAATQARCKQLQAGTYQLAQIAVGSVTKNGTVFLVNKTGFNEKLSGFLADLSFVPGSVDTKPGWTKLFECDMYDVSHVKHVSVFAK